MKQKYKGLQGKSKKQSMEQIKKNYKDKMKELMPEQFNQKEPSLEEKINDQINKAKEEASYSDQLRPYYLGRQRAFEWVLEQMRKDYSA
jgi:hypothetical protein